MYIVDHNLFKLSKCRNVKRLAYLMFVLPYVCLTLRLSYFVVEPFPTRLPHTGK
jgi:hypothetical protein